MHNLFNYLINSAAAAKSLQSCLTLQSQRRQPTRLPRPWDSPGKNTGGGCHFLLQCMKVKSEVTQSCPTLGDPMGYGLPHSSVHGIFQARVLEWVAISFSRGSFQPRDWTQVSWIVGRYFTVWATRKVQGLSLLKLMSIELVMPSNRLIFCHPLLLLPSIFPSIRVFSNEFTLHITWPEIGVSASSSVLPMNIQEWFPLQLTDLISLQPKGLSRVFSSTTVQKHHFFSTEPSLWSNSHIHTWPLEKP